MEKPTLAKTRSTLEFDENREKKLCFDCPERPFCAHLGHCAVPDSIERARKFANQRHANRIAENRPWKDGK